MRIADRVDDAAYQPDKPEPERKLTAIERARDPQERDHHDQILDRIDMRAMGALELRMADGRGRCDFVFGPVIGAPASQRQSQKTGENGVNGSKIIGKRHDLFPRIEPAGKKLNRFFS